MVKSIDIIAIVIGLLYLDSILLLAKVAMHINDSLMACLTHYNGIANYQAAKCVATNPVGYDGTMLAYLADIYRPP